MASRLHSNSNRREVPCATKISGCREIREMTMSRTSATTDGRERGCVRLLLGGDVMLGRGVNELIHRIGPEYPVEMLTPVTREADLFFVNLECAIYDRSELFPGAAKAFYFRADPPAVQTLQAMGVHLVTLANNHALDAGYDALLDTLAILDAHNIAHAGAGENLAAARRAACLTVGDIRFGIIAACDHQPDFAATDRSPGIHYVDLRDNASIDALVNDAAELARRVDHAIVSLHWQPNWAPRIAPRYHDVARRLIDTGVRIIWGHSPHHFQGVEWFDNRVVIYSAGDLLDDYAVNANFRNDRQLLFEATVSAAGVERLRALPIELEYAHPHPALPEAHTWATLRLSALCAELNSNVVGCDDGWLDIRPTK